MSIELKIIDPTNFSSWDELVLSTQRYSFFHSSAWSKVLHESYNYKPVYFCFFNNDQISVLLPFMEVNSLFGGRRGVSLPFSDYCGPLIGKGIEIKKILDLIISYGKKSHWKYFEIRCISANLMNEEPSTRFYKHLLKLNKSAEQIFSSFRKGTKSTIKKAIRSGIKIQSSNSSIALEEFYRLNCLTRKRHGLPPQPLKFFKKLYEHVILKNLGFVTIASFGGKVISAAIFLNFGRKAIYKYAASDGVHENIGSNNLLLWETIKWYVKNNYDSICFGRTALSNEGLNRFKSGWGTEVDILNYYNYNFKSGSFVRSDFKLKGFHNAIFNKLPVPTLKLFSSLFYKQIG